MHIPIFGTNIHFFQLEVFDEELGEALKIGKKGPFDMDKIMDKVMTLEEGRSLRQKYRAEYTQALAKMLIEQQKVNSEWRSFTKWLTEVKPILYRDFLFKSIDVALLPLIFSQGSTTAHMTEKFENEQFQKVNLPKSAYIWASYDINRAWEHHQNNNPRVIVVYKKSHFRNTTEFGTSSTEAAYVWVRKDTRVDYQESVEAVIQIWYRY